VSVQSPSGSPVALHSRSGGSTDDLVGWYDTERTPAEPLSRLRGEHAAGTWTLRISDGVPANPGVLRGWSVEACGRPFEASTPEMRFRDVTRAGGQVTFRWWQYPGVTSYRVYRSSSPASPASFVDVSAEDADTTDTAFGQAEAGTTFYFLVSGVGPGGEGPR
jgi:subtilisin-like proprotein convertase family protein